MEASKRTFLPAIASLILILTPLILTGCKPQSQDINEAKPTLTVSPTIAPVESVSDLSNIPAEVVFDIDHRSNGLTLGFGGDVDTELVEVVNLQEQVFRTGNGMVMPSADGNPDQDCCMRFQVDDDLIYAGSPTLHVQIEIEYLDEGTDKFNIQYDSLSDGIFTESDVVTKTGSGEFKTTVFTLNDAYFANRQYGGDFRIFDMFDGAETIRRVTLTLLVSETDEVLTSTKTPPSTTDAIPEDQASLIFHNGVILTMESDIAAAAIAINDERILAVGSYEEVLAFAGSGTTLVDLEGHTLMPGFVDPHSHVLSNWRDDLIGAQDYIISEGITTYTEMTADETLMREITALDREGELRLRVSLYPRHVDNCGNVVGAWYLEDYPVSREPGAMLQIPGVKIFNDGGSCNVPATSFEYIGISGHGDLYFSVEELTNMIVELQNNGYQAAIHGLGDRAIDVNQDAIAAALAGGENIYRHRIEHNTLLRDDMIPRYSEFDIVPMIFGFFPTCGVISDSTQSKYVTPEEFKDWEWRWRPLIDANPDVHIAWHADSPPMGPLDPILHLYGFVTRRQVREDGSICEPPEWAADDVLTVEEALPLMTIEAAYALLREEEIGSLKAGKLADLIILSDNPLEVDHEAILDIQVLMTMVGGKVEHCAQGHEAFCP